MKRFEITELPPYLILYIKVSFVHVMLIYFVLFDKFFDRFQRFTKNTFFVEKNPTIVNFPVK